MKRLKRILHKAKGIRAAALALAAGLLLCAGPRPVFAGETLPERGIVPCLGLALR